VFHHAERDDYTMFHHAERDDYDERCLQGD
jgi:hypothetical protein